MVDGDRRVIVVEWDEDKVKVIKERVELMYFFCFFLFLGEWFVIWY